MKINKQLFEDVLSGKLKGTFRLKNGFTVRSNRLFNPNSINSYTYALKGFSTSFTESGKSSSAGYDIIDFTPESNMKETELTIKIPKGQEIDWQESAKQEKIVFKNINTKPKSWEEYLRSGNHPNKLWFINPAYKSTGGIESTGGDIKDFNLNKSGCCMSAYLPSKELTEAFLAMMQLMSLRQAWIDDWEPDWSDSDRNKWCIVNDINRFVIGLYGSCSRPLSFPTKEMATDFMNCFKDLLEIAKPLI